MKTTFVLLLFSIFFISCDKDSFLIPRKEVPEWLKAKIAADEKEIKDNPKSGRKLVPGSDTNTKGNIILNMKI